MNIFTRIVEKHLLRKDLRLLVKAYRAGELKVVLFDRYKFGANYSPASRITFVKFQGSSPKYIHVTAAGHLLLGREFNHMNLSNAPRGYEYLFYLAAKDEERKIISKEKIKKENFRNAVIDFIKG